MSTALVLLADGFEEMEAISPIDILRRGGVDVVTASIGRSREVAGAHGVTVLADRLLSELDGDDFDALILPGGSKGTENLGASAAVRDRLVRQKESGGLVCAICAAPTLLAPAGVLDDGQHVTCYPSCAPDLDRECANVPVVHDGDVVTGQAAGSALLFALVILKALEGEAVAAKIARAVVTDVFSR